jgi:hypothetical protein
MEKEVAKRPFLAFSIILCGILLIIAGLGYTVNRASEYNARSVETLESHTISYDTLPVEPENSHEYHPSVGADDLGSQGITVPRQVEAASEFDKPSFVFPALSLLSGAVLAAIGAIALMHRWRGIGVH